MRLRSQRVLLVGSFLALCVIVLCIDRGFDFTDEGYYLLSYQDMERGLFHVTHASWIINAAFGWMDPGVQGYRLIRLVLTSLSTLALSYCFHRWIEGVESREATLSLPERLAHGQVAALAGFAFDPRSISYNTLNAALTLLFVGLVLIFIRGRSSYAPALLLGMGALLGVQFFVKFPTSLLFLGLTLGFLLIHPANRPGRWRTALALLAGWGMTVGLVFATVLDVSIWKVGFLEGIVGIGSARMEHSPALLFELYARWLGQMAAVLGVIFLPLHVTVYRMSRALVLAGSEEDRLALLASGRRARTLAVAVYSVAAMIFVIGMGSLVRTRYAYPQCLVLLALAVALVPIVHRQGFRSLATAREIWGALLLLLCPYLATAGTANTSLYQVLYFLPLWIAAQDLLAGRIEDRLKVPGLRRDVLFISGMVTLVLFFDGHVIRPYRLNGTLLEQTEPVAGFPRLAGLKVDRQTREFLDELRRVIDPVQETTPRRPILGFYDLPGYVYVLGGRSPGCIWYGSFLEPKYLRHLLEKSAPGELHDPILLTSQPIHPLLEEFLDQRKILPGRDLPLRGEIPRRVNGKDLDRWSLLRVYARDTARPGTP